MNWYWWALIGAGIWLILLGLILVFMHGATGGPTPRSPKSIEDRWRDTSNVRVIRPKKKDGWRGPLP